MLTYSGTPERDVKKETFYMHAIEHSVHAKITLPKYITSPSFFLLHGKHAFQGQLPFLSF